MSSPFRSHSEQLREQVRRVEQQVRALEGRHADLQRALALRGRRRPWVKISLVAILVAMVVGFKVGHLDASHQDGRALATYHQTVYDAAEVEYVELLDCQTLQRSTMAATAACRVELERRRR